MVTMEKNISILHLIDWNFPGAKTDELTHGFHPYPAKFIPQIPRNIIKLLSKEGDIVLDPFCGSGTTGVVAIRYKRKFVGIDSERKYLDELAIPRLKDEISQRKQRVLFNTSSIRENIAEYGILP